MIDANKCVTLRRNPQFLTPKQMDSLKESIRRDGFCAPILVRPFGKNKFEVISGNHRFMAAHELEFKKIPCVIAKLSDQSAQRLAINLNTIHGNPNAELLAPFLAELDIEVLQDIFLEDETKKMLLEFDSTLEELLNKMKLPDALNRKSTGVATIPCICPKCGAHHVKASGAKSRAK